MLGEKENNKYLGILEEDTLKQAEIKEKNMKRIPPKNDKASRSQALQKKSHQMDKYQGCPTYKILGPFLK